MTSVASSLRRSVASAASLLPLAAKHFGVAAFRPLQREAIDANLAGRDSLCVLPTGSGKSLCYQLPAVLPLPAGEGRGEGGRGGVTLVVSPLLALMKDQVDALKARNVPADVVNSDHHWRDNEIVLRLAKDGRLRLLYASPERCGDPQFLAALRMLDLRAFVIDEAHCIATWGYDFRPAYAELCKLRVLCPGVPVHAFTATATPRVRQQIKESLMLRSPVELVGDFDRPNLRLSVHDCTGQDRDQALVALLPRCVAASSDAIVYCNTRAETERVATLLNTASPLRPLEPLNPATLDPSRIEAHAYHAGLKPDRRRAVQDWLMGSEPSLRGSAASSKIVVATVAFGLGIDKPDVRFVIHFGMPSSLDVYHQEIGRAGRDGAPAECVLLYDRGDYWRWVSMFCGGRHLEAGKLDALLAMESYCGIRGPSLDDYMGRPGCRHAHLVEYFGQDGRAQGEGVCNACDVCLSAPLEPLHPSTLEPSSRSPEVVV